MHCAVSELLGTEIRSWKLPGLNSIDDFNFGLRFAMPVSVILIQAKARKCEVCLLASEAPGAILEQRYRFSNIEFGLIIGRKYKQSVERFAKKHQAW